MNQPGHHAIGIHLFLEQTTIEGGVTVVTNSDEWLQFAGRTVYASGEHMVERDSWHLAADPASGIDFPNVASQTDTAAPGDPPDIRTISSSLQFVRVGHPAPFKLRWEQVVYDEVTNTEDSRTSEELAFDCSTTDDTATVSFPALGKYVSIEDLILVTPIVNTY